METLFFLILLMGTMGGMLLFMELFLQWREAETLTVPSCVPVREADNRGVTAREYTKAYQRYTCFQGWDQERGGDETTQSKVTGYTGSGVMEGHGKGGKLMGVAQEVSGIELVKVPVVIGEELVQHMEISDLNLEFPAQKIRHVEARVVDLTYEVIGNKVIVQGIIHKQVFYVGVDNVVHHQQEDVPFSLFVDIPGAEGGMTAQLYPRVEHIRPELIQEGTVLHQKMVIEIFVKVTETRQVFLETTTTGPLMKVERVIGENATQILVEGQVTLPIPAIKVTEIDARVEAISAEVLDHKVIIQGDIHKQIFFIGEDDIEHHFADTLSFSHFVDLPGAQAGMNVQVYPVIEYVKAELTPEGDILNQEVILELFVKVSETVQIHLALGGDLMVKVPQVVGEGTRQIMVESTLPFAQPVVKVKEVIARIEDLRTVMLSGKVIIQGIIHKQIFYVGEDNMEYHQAEDIPFSTFVEMPGAEPGMAAQVQPIIEHLQPEFNQEGDLLHQKIILEFFVKVTEEVQVKARPVEVVPYEPYESFLIQEE